MRRVELFEIMRKDHEFGLSIRAIAEKRGVHRRMVRQALASPVPSERKVPERHCPVMTDDLKAFIDGILVADKDAPKKQRHTARRLWQRCRDEFGSSAAEVTVRRYVRGRRRELGVGIQAFVPQHHAIGAQAEVDFYEAAIDFPFGRRKAKIITVRSEFSAASLHIAYPAQTQSALIEGIALGLEFLGGVFASMRFDNLTQAVARIVRGERRIEQDRFIAFRSHYLFESSFTSPGIEGAHEKGGIENEVGRFRRRWLTPVPNVSSWAELNDYLRACCIKDLGRTLPGAAMTVGAAAGLERALLKDLPAERFEVCELAEARADQKARVSVRAVRYSVPASLVGRKLQVRVSPMSVEISHEGRVVAAHDRLHLRGAESLMLDHYLDVFVDKPGAFPGSLPLHQARSRGDFPASYDTLWTKLRTRAGDKAGTRAMIEVLLLHRKHPQEVVAAAVDQALHLGSIDPSLIEMLARQRAQGALFEPAPAEVGELARYDRPLPDTSCNDGLLTMAVTS